jgi:hypothetical protein
MVSEHPSGDDTVQRVISLPSLECTDVSKVVGIEYVFPRDPADAS